MNSITLYRPVEGEEVLEGEALVTYTREDIENFLIYRNKRLGKTQFYNWLKYCEIRPSRSNSYSVDDYQRLMHFATLMKRYGYVKTAKLKFHQRYPQENLQEESVNDLPKQAQQAQPNEQRSYTYQSAPASDIASAFGF